MKQIVALFWSFFKIGVFTFGGGYAMIPLIEREVIDKRQWVARQEFLDLLTLAQTAPGPIALNTGVFVGYKRCGFWGAVAAVLGIIVPSFTIILCIAMLFADFRHNPWVDAAFKGMRPAVVALIVFPIWNLSKRVARPWWCVIVATAIAVWWLRWSPIYILLATALLGVVWTWCESKTKQQ